ncbi:protein-S-isoprenylcysteine O-methyltransferase [Mesorhizobium sp. BAC0120]|uniref:protein-S-isoprenylcysteine O-methyltransferase n=1 Tax=Mesorhizobium sp. BAC0120 TaxID=3090670 RepID=UPI00298CE914|nr:protein-S-isoprenylcysteine O-methyltransferase [Mesorhizobium sp. BAC0120]MDW6025528.1 protein-S-isoprenylcysteine O-methyltransferase [Mesorhizobium sp. BAC0120]
MTTASVGEGIWVLGIIAWYVIRYPFERRAKRVQVVRDSRSQSDTLGLAAALLGMAILPALYLATGFPRSADYLARAWAIALGTVIFASGLLLFRVSHKQLGRNWSITLQIRREHRLVSTGPYALIRHPMYTSFLLMALGQAFLLSNWVVGLAGLLGFAVLFLLRVDKEEHMMLENFGPEYRPYMKRTKRIIPYLY